MRPKSARVAKGGARQHDRAGRHARHRLESLEPRTLLSATAELLVDLNQQPIELSSLPTNIVDLRGIAYFSADDGIHGRELWRSDGTAEGTWLVKDINPNGHSLASSHVYSQLTPIGDRLYFVAEDDVHGSEVWQSDGTEAGTVLLKDIAPGSAGAAPSYLTDFNGRLLFWAFHPAYADEPWLSDGTEAGTQLIKDIRPGPAELPRRLTEFVVNGPTAYFSAIDDEHGGELWKTDGTNAGTSLVADLAAGPSQSQVNNLTVMDGLVYFTARTNIHGLWRSDGTAEGTTLVKQFSIIEHVTGMAVVDSTLYVAAGFSGSSATLYRSDGTPEGTVAVRQYGSGAGVRLENLIANDGAVIYTVQSGSTTPVLWRSEGTGDTTEVVKSIGGTLSKYAILDGTLYFSTENVGSNYRLWRSDGTTAGTELVQDVHSFRFGELAVVGGSLVFHMGTPTNFFDTELWRYGGATEGPEFVRNINAAFKTESAHPRIFFEFDGLVYFTTSASGLWRSDGTAGGTYKLADYYSGPIAAMLGQVYFAYNNGLYRTDGTVEGTTFVVDIPQQGDSQYLHSLTHAGGRLFFVNHNDNGWELWSTDGTEGGTHELRDIKPSYEDANPHHLTEVDGTLFFIADDGVHGRALWKSDGTEAGTMLVKDVDEHDNESPPFYPYGGERFSSLTSFHDRLFFITSDGEDDPQHGREVWQSDGSAEGTVLLKDIAAGAAGSYPADLVVGGDSLYFTAREYDGDRVVWKSDGTAEGTLPVGWHALTDSRDPARLTFAGQTLYFTASTPKAPGSPDYTVQLWKIEPGATPARVFNTGASPENPSVRLLERNGALYFFLDGDIWTSAGTERGTVKLMHRSAGSYTADQLASASGKLLFAHDDGVHGVELWSLGPFASIADRRVFYNNSAFDGNEPAPGPADDAAVAPDKTALLAGQTASFANYTSYSRGINGLAIDVRGLADPVALSAADFEFRLGNVNDPSAWSLALAPASVSVRPGAGDGGADRVTLIWPDGAIVKIWLEVTMRATAATGLAAADIFYFGSAPGEVGNSSLHALVNASDEIQIRVRPSTIVNPAPIDSRYDINRDRLVNATDQILARTNSTSISTALRLIIPLAATVPPPVLDDIPLPDLAEAALVLADADEVPLDRARRRI